MGGRAPISDSAPPGSKQHLLDRLRRLSWLSQDQIREISEASRMIEIKRGGNIYAQGDSANTYIFEGFNTATGGYCHIDENGNLACSGSEDVKAVRTRHVNSGGQHVLAYAAESASAILDDVGTGRMVGGIAHVVIDRAFGSVIDRNSPYHVFLTPMGDTRGLYVSAKAPSGFEVRETQGGRSTLSFDYRIVARPLDAKDDRLPIAPAARVPTARQARKGTQ